MNPEDINTHPFKYDDFYNIQNISKGMLGPIFKCEHRHIKSKIFLLKTYPHHNAIQEQAKEILAKETAIFERIPLNCKPQIIPNYYGVVSNVWNDKKSSYTIFEYHESITFEDAFIQKGKKIEFDKFYEYFLLLVKALAFLQKKEINHQGISTQTIQIDEKGNIYLFGFLMSQLADKKSKNKCYKLDVFRLASVLLEITNKTHIVICNTETIQKELDSFEKFYRKEIKPEQTKKFEHLFCILKECLDFDDNRRPDFFHLLSKFFDLEEDMLLAVTCSNYLPKAILEQSNIGAEENKFNFEYMEKKELISKGSFGVVHKTKNKFYPDKDFAIKSMSYSDENMKEKIVREINIWKKLQAIKEKPGCIPAFYGSSEQDLGLAGKCYHLCFEYIPKSMEDLLKDFKKNSLLFPLNEVLKYARTLINCLAFLQTHQVCHRDLKPSNLLLDEKGNVFLIDFSESKEVALIKQNEMLSDSTLCGTPMYFPPELDECHKLNMTSLNLNPYKSDVFSLGLILLEMGTLKVPKRNQNKQVWEKNIKDMINNFENIYMNKVSEDLEKELVTGMVKMLGKCLRIDPTKRPDFIGLYYKFQNSFRRKDDEILRKQILMAEEFK